MKGLHKIDGSSLDLLYMEIVPHFILKNIKPYCKNQVKCEIVHRKDTSTILLDRE